VRRNRRGPAWSLLSNHGQVLLYVARTPDSTQIDMALDLAIDLRSLSRVIHELESAGMLTVTKIGRSNHYEVVWDCQLRAPFMKDRKVRDLLWSLVDTNAGALEITSAQGPIQSQEASTIDAT
jgi:hypothetical protein